MVRGNEGVKSYYLQKIEDAETKIRERTENLRRLEAQRNELNSKGSAFTLHFHCPSILLYVCAFVEIAIPWCLNEVAKTIHTPTV